MKQKVLQRKNNKTGTGRECDKGWLNKPAES